MRKIVYSVAMSLDGYVAGPNGEADWIIMDPEIDFMAMFARFDTVIMGRRSFEATQAMGQGESMPGIKSMVVSRTMQPEDHPDLAIIGDDLGSAIARLEVRARQGHLALRRRFAVSQHARVKRSRQHRGRHHTRSAGRRHSVSAGSAWQDIASAGQQQSLQGDGDGVAPVRCGAVSRNYPNVRIQVIQCTISMLTLQLPQARS